MRRKVFMGLVALAIALILTAAIVVSLEFFAPETGTVVEDELLDGPGVVILKQGTFRGADSFHFARGTAAIVQIDDAYFLRFVDFEHRLGPDVYVYLTARPDARSTADVESGARVLIPGGADGGESTVKGSFDVLLPGHIDPADYHGVVLWCDQFNEYFGGAPLTPP